MRTDVRRSDTLYGPQNTVRQSGHSRTTDVLNAPRPPILAVETNESVSGLRVTFYVRRTEATFTTNPERVADGFLSHYLGRRVIEGGPDVRRYLDRFVATYLALKGAGWERYGQPDPHRTRTAYDTVSKIVRDRLEN
jgi:hypothetical protein